MISGYRIESSSEKGGDRGDIVERGFMISAL